MAKAPKVAASGRSGRAGREVAPAATGMVAMEGAACQRKASLPVVPHVGKNKQFSKWLLLKEMADPSAHP